MWQYFFFCDNVYKQMYKSLQVIHARTQLKGATALSLATTQSWCLVVLKLEEVQKHYNPGSLVRDESLIEKRRLYSKVEWSGLLERWNIAMAIWDDCERTLDGRLEHWIAHLLPYTRLAPRHWIVNTTNWLECYGPRTPLLDCLCSTLHTVISLGYRCNAKHIIVLQFSICM